VAATDTRPESDALAEIRALFEHSSDIVTILEADGTWRSTSPAGERLLGWPVGYEPTPDGVLGFVHDDDKELAATSLAEVFAGTRGPDDAVVIRVRGADGGWHHLETRGRDLRDDPAVRGIVLTSRDVTKQRTAEERVQLLSRVLETSHELVVLCDPRGRVLYANDIARNEYGVVEGDAPVKLANSLFSAYEDQLTTEVMPSLQDEGAWSGEFVLRNRAGEDVPLAVTLQMHHLPGGDAQIISTIAHDIRELKSIQAQLEHQATHDPLTGLTNRPLFQELGEQALARSDRHGTTVAVLFLDLDRFKPVNDSFGHTVGDELLVQIAARLRASVRRGDAVARFGGDEFVVLCEHPAGQREMGELADRLIHALSEPVPVVGATAEVGASVGIAIGGGGRVTIDTLIRDADAALYQAKEEGRSRAVLFGSRA
jgi:diguanylate cyclase (GGDEF)-like protein/PAS domain S-box-containing protein